MKDRAPAHLQEVAKVVNERILRALQEDESLLEVRKLAEFLNVCGGLLENHSPELEGTPTLDRRVCVGKHITGEISTIADRLLGHGSETQVQALREELQLQRDSTSFFRNSTGDQDLNREHQSFLYPDNRFARPSGYGQIEIPPLFREWLTMDRKTLMKRIPNSAARIFALGIVSIVVGVIASFLTDYHLTKLLVVIGFGLIATGQHIGERSISGGRS